MLSLWLMEELQVVPVVLGLPYVWERSQYSYHQALLKGRPGKKNSFSLSPQPRTFLGTSIRWEWLVLYKLCVNPMVPFSLFVQFVLVSTILSPCWTSEVHVSMGVILLCTVTEYYHTIHIHRWRITYQKCSQGSFKKEKQPSSSKNLPMTSPSAR